MVAAADYCYFASPGIAGAAERLCACAVYLSTFLSLLYFKTFSSSYFVYAEGQK